MNCQIILAIGYSIGAIAGIVASIYFILNKIRKAILVAFKTRVK